jgi:hypothetical protein
MVNSYNLVNPYVKGTFNKRVKAKNSVEAAKKLYNGLSEHFNNNIPKFHFSIQKGKSGNGKIYHFEVQEKKEGDNVKFSIQPHTIKNAATNNKKFQKRLANFKGRSNSLLGGDKKRSKKKKSKKRKKSKRKKDDSSESSSEEYYETKYISTVDQPLYYWWYDPYVYGIDTYYSPTFYSYTTPYIESVVVADYFI